MSDDLGRTPALLAMIQRAAPGFTMTELRDLVDGPGPIRLAVAHLGRCRWCRDVDSSLCNQGARLLRRVSQLRRRQPAETCAVWRKKAGRWLRCTGSPSVLRQGQRVCTRHKGGRVLIFRRPSVAIRVLSNGRRSA